MTATTPSSSGAQPSDKNNMQREKEGGADNGVMATPSSGRAEPNDDSNMQKVRAGRANNGIISYGEGGYEVVDDILQSFTKSDEEKWRDSQKREPD